MKRENRKRNISSHNRHLKRILNKDDFDSLSKDDGLEIAQTLQQRLLNQHTPSMDTLDICARYIPAEKVGGDYYHIVSLNGTSIALLIFDVSGHGLTAARITALAELSFESHIKNEHNPAAVLAGMNMDIHGKTPGAVFVTAFLMVLDIESGNGYYSNAGHVPPLLHHTDGRDIEELTGGGTFLGMIENIEYTQSPILLKNGEKIILYTDGLVEAMNRGGELYGRERLLDIIRQNANSDCTPLVETILEHNALFLDGTPLQDDLCLLAIEKKECLFSRLLRRRLTEKEMDSLSSWRLNTEEEIDTVCTALSTELQRCAYGDTESKKLRIVCIEMLMNALYHGNGGDSSKWVKFAFHVTSDRTILAVLDQGEGFDYSRLPDPTEPENRSKTTGRGIFIVKGYVDSIEYFEKGRCILTVTHRKQGNTNRSMCTP
jgi:serine phosphatase RsbU (regulator of sigma subunit)/anti-sigma regulatory factor (Ser/Thr protein kinase)